MRSVCHPDNARDVALLHRMVGIASLHPPYKNTNSESDATVGWVEAPCADTHR